MNDRTSTDTPATSLSVSELNRQARVLLEQGLSRLWVEGEVSNLVRPASGHVYFTLKDSGAQLRCAWFRQRQRGPTIHLENGDNILAFGRVSIYEARGDYQLIVERTEAAGEGELRRRYELLKKRLQAEGLFDEDTKQDLPALPRRVGVVTSSSGAAIRDILSVLRRRFAMVPVTIYPAAVQGEAAAAEIAAAIKTANRRAECEVLIVGRGGGSLEDLWPFNEEVVARAIYESEIPVVSAVGHEVDFTIADFVADLRAPTPSGAAELVVPDQADWLRRLQVMTSRMSTSSRRYLDDSSQALDWLGKRLAQSSPAATVARQGAWLKNLRQVLIAAMRHGLARHGQLLERDRSLLLQQSPAQRVQGSAARLQQLQQRLATSAIDKVSRQQNRLNVMARGLHSVSPLATLERGYALVTEAATGRVLTDASSVEEGSAINARLARGSVAATVTRTYDEESS